MTKFVPTVSLPEATMIDDSLLADLQAKARAVRRDIVTMVHRANSGHVGGSLSATDILVALYHAAMRIEPSNPRWESRDRFVLSKGHCTPVLYAVLAQCGFFPREDLETFRSIGSHLQGHPYQPKTPGVDASGPHESADNAPEPGAIPEQVPPHVRLRLDTAASLNFR